MTQQQVATAPVTDRYADWREAYREDVVERVKHWGDKRKRGGTMLRDYGGLDVALFEPGR